MIFEIYNKSMNYKMLGLNILLAIPILYIGLVFNTDIGTFIKAFNTIANDSGHTLPFYYEPIRYKQLLTNYPYLIIPFYIGCLGLYKLYKSELKNDNKKFFNVFYTSFIFIVIYLMLLGTKWEYYLTLEFPFIFIGISYFIYSLNIDKKYIYNLLVGIILIIALFKFPKNEEFLRTFNIPSGRVSIVESVKEETKGYTVFAPIQTFFIFKNSSDLIAFEQISYRTIEKKFDYIVMNILVDKNIYEKKFNIKLEYRKSFIYNDSQFNLFKVLK
jgi:hypothetical protein